MATTAKQSSTSAVSSRASSTSPLPHQSHHTSPSGVTTAASAFSEAAAAEDIETIAKQISDHAEAIYQTWKARGLAPTEILNCHTVGGGETFGKALTPAPHSQQQQQHSHHFVQQQQQQQQHQAQPHRRSKPTSPSSSEFTFGGVGGGVGGSAHSPAGPDMSNNNNLEKLVNSFVHEDKARQQQAAARKTTTTSILTSGTIRDALRKFESADRGATSTATAAKAPLRPNYVVRSNNSSLSQRMPGSGAALTPAATTAAAAASSVASTNASSTVSVNQQQQQPPKSSAATSIAITTNTNTATPPMTATNATNAATSASTTTTTTTPTKLNKHVPDVLMNTIEQSASVVASPKESSPPPPLYGTPSASSGVATYRQKPETPAKPASLINHQPSWKGRSPSSPSSNSSPVVASSPPSSSSSSATPAAAPSKKSSVTTTTNGHNALNGSPATPAASPTVSVGGHKVGASKTRSSSASAARKAAADLLDEVLQEEERLINALKTGTVLSSGGKTVHTLPEVITSTMQPDCERVWPPQEPSVLSPTTTAVHTTAASAITTNGKSTKLAAATASSDEPDNASRAGAAQMLNGTAAAIGTKKTTTGTVHDMPASALAAMKITKSPRPRNDAAVPHPDISSSGSSLSKLGGGSGGSSAKGGGSTSTVRPFLARGSVAERVLMFEKCPDHQPLRREPSKLTVKPAPPAPEQHTTLQRRIRSSKNVYIPKFYYPHGKPTLTITADQTLQRILTALDAFPNRQPARERFDEIVEACGYPRYWRMPLFSCAQLTAGGPADGKRFIDFWKEMNVYCHDDTSRFIYIMARGDRTRPYIQSEDLITLVQDVVDTHPGLAFLKEASEFHSRYVHTVIARIFYTVNRSWTGRITVPELRRSNLLQVLQLLEEEEDINQIMAYFSYEHFYVIYCKFWELDRDHDLYIDQNDLARHNDHALSTRIIERIFSGCVTKGAKTRQGAQDGKMSYTEFVWFLLSEEDKTHPTAVEYWFRCMDLDGDGVLSMYELEYFYEEQQHRMESIGIETLPFEDCLCQMLDMVKPKRSGYVTLGDLKRCKTTPIFFDTFFNLEKYMEHEQRDPFATQRDQDEMTDWDRFAAQEYELLVAEEGGDTQGSYDEDEYESNIDILESQLDGLDCMVNEW